MVGMRARTTWVLLAWLMLAAAPALAASPDDVAALSQTKSLTQALVDQTASLSALTTELKRLTEQRAALVAQRRSVVEIDKLIAALQIKIEWAKRLTQERKDALQTSTVTLAAKAAKLKKDNDSISKGMEEAREKADIAMQQATTALTVGIAAGATQVAAAAAAPANTMDAGTPIAPAPVLKR